ncbi:MAG: zinc ribbon domain-containing protein [Acidimicrobiales bacterium]|jgi:hypothetical protein
MACQQCGTENPLGTHFCANCGAALTQQAPAQVQQPIQGQPVQQGPTPIAIGIDFKRLGMGDYIAGVGTLILFISLFLNWYSYSGYGSVTALGNGAGGWRFLILILNLVVIGYLIARAMVKHGMRLPIPHWQLLTGILGLQLLLTVISFFVKPVGGLAGWDVGAFLGLIAAVIAFAGGILRKQEPENIVPGAPRASFQSLMPQSMGGAATSAPTGGAPVAGGCARCGAANAPGTAFCTSCGNRLA